MRKGTLKAPPYTDDQIRQVMLQYFYDRNRRATGMMGGARGAAVKISAICKDLKASHGLKRAQVVSNLTYLLSQGWVERQPLQKTFPTPTGA